MLKYLKELLTLITGCNKDGRISTCGFSTNSNLVLHTFSEKERDGSLGHNEYKGPLLQK